MSTLVKRDRNPFADLVDWLESEFPGFGGFRPFSGMQMVRVEDYTDGQEYVLRAELPGIDPDRDVELTVQDGVLTLRAERREERTEAHRSEFRYGTFTRSLTLPPGADESAVRATYRDGILEIRVGMKAEEKGEPRHITIAKE
jgi:HSP20 family molecular chaperone IbpA